MSDKVISSTGSYTGYAAAASVDATNDYMLIQQSGVYKKVSRNVLLGVTGTPMDTSTAQNVTNKTLDTTNTVSLLDTLFSLKDNVDPTKIAQFQLSGITTGTTRTYTLPNGSSTLVDLSTTQTLTGKTLTSPTITGGSIDNSTITVDSIGEHTAAAGVTVDGLNVKDGKLNTNNSVVSSNITNGNVQPQHLVSGTGAGWAWSTWAPTWTNLTVGNGTLTAKFIQIGKTIVGRIDLVFGTTTTVGGSVAFTWPATAVSYGGSGNLIPVGSAFIYDTSASRAFKASILMTSTTTGTLYAETADATYVYASPLAATVPFGAAYAVGDELGLAFEIEAA